MMLVVVEEISQEVYKTKRKCLAVAMVRMHGIELITLMESGCVPKCFLPQLVRNILLHQKETKKVVTIGNGDRSDVLGKVMDVLVLF